MNMNAKKNPNIFHKIYTYALDITCINFSRNEKKYYLPTLDITI